MSEQPATQSSPLAEAEPANLDELFARLDGHIAQRTLRSPEALKIADTVVAELRRQRAAWAQAEASGARRAPATKRTSAAKTSLQDLGLID